MTNNQEIKPVWDISPKVLIPRLSIDIPTRRNRGPLMPPITYRRNHKEWKMGTPSIERKKGKYRIWSLGVLYLAIAISFILGVFLWKDAISFRRNWDYLLNGSLMVLNILIGIPIIYMAITLIKWIIIIINKRDSKGDDLQTGSTDIPDKRFAWEAIVSPMIALLSLFMIQSVFLSGYYFKSVNIFYSCQLFLGGAVFSLLSFFIGIAGLTRINPRSQKVPSRIMIITGIVLGLMNCSIIAFIIMQFL